METTFETIQKVIVDIIDCDPSDITPETRFITDLDADSLDVIDLTFSLGKELDITLPNKTVIVHGAELCGDEELLVNNGALTDIGAEFLIHGPNRYSPDKVSEGTSLIDVFENTQILNWVNLCDAILQSESRNGDTVILDYAEKFLKPYTKDKAS